MYALILVVCLGGLCSERITMHDNIYNCLDALDNIKLGLTYAEAQCEPLQVNKD